MFRRGLMPRAELTQTITHRWLSAESLWLRSSVAVQNRGDVVIRISEAESRLLQVLPLAGEAGRRIQAGGPARPAGRSEVDWPELDTCKDSDSTFHVEPGETGVLNWDFVVSCVESSKPEVVIVYHHLRNPAKEPLRQGAIGWDAETVYDVGDAQGSMSRQIQVEAGRRSILGGRNG